jgi:pimeloyl-ACP methyl ester carboxylesterase
MISPMIFLHAFPLSPSMFDDLRREMSSPFHSPGLPGFGSSPLSQEQASMTVIAKSVLAYADEQKMDRFIAGGVSLGGYVVMELMRIAPDRIPAALLIDTKAGEDALPTKANRERIARLALQHGTDSLLGALLPPLTGATTKGTNPEVIERLSEIFRQSDPAAIAWTQRAMAGRPDSFSTLKNFERPLLVIVGSEDEIAPIDDARKMADVTVHGELVVIEGAGHLAVMEQPKRSAKAIEEWLGKI